MSDIENNLAAIEEVTPVDNTPVEAPAPEAEIQEAPAVENQEAPSEETPEEAGDKSLDELPLPEANNENKKELPKWIEKKLSKRERELQAKEQEIALLRQQIERGQQTAPNAPGAPTQAHIPNVAPPRREDFANEDDYLDAKLEYREHVKEFKRRTESQQQAFVNFELSFQNKMKSAIDAGSDHYDDFEDVTKDVLYGNKIPHNRAMSEAVVDSEYSHDILYFLGKYPDKAREIAQLNPVQAVKKIAEIEARFAAKKTQAKKSNAPAPMGERLKTNNASPLLDIVKVAEAGSQKDFEAMVNKLNSQRANPWG